VCDTKHVTAQAAGHGTPPELVQEAVAQPKARERLPRTCAPVSGALKAPPGDAAAVESEGEPVSGLTGNETLTKDDDDFDQHVDMEDGQSPLPRGRGTAQIRRRGRSAGAGEHSGPCKKGKAE
jgi:hypothetical protein